HPHVAFFRLPPPHTAHHSPSLHDALPILTINDVREMAPDRLILSPGPCTPDEAGICNDLIPEFRGVIPILGVCLGHQCIGATHGMAVRRARSVMHGKTSPIFHDGRGIFSGLPNPFIATRYHSLIVERDSVSDDFEVSAWTEDGVVMALRWVGGAPDAASVDGVQFHPESFLTPHGPWILANFLEWPRPALDPVAKPA